MMVDHSTHAEIDAVRAENIELLARLKAARGALADIFDGQPQWPDNAKKELMWCRKRAKEAYRATGDALRDAIRREGTPAVQTAWPIKTRSNV